MYYIARWYDPTIARFAQADSVVPAGVQGYDRYAYASNAPTRYVDPTGHKPCWATAHYSCNVDLSQLIFEKNQRLAKQVEAGKINGLEAFARLADYAASFAPNCASCLIDNLGSVLTGHSNGHYWWNEMKGEVDTYYAQADSLGQSGYDQVFQDPQSAFEQGPLGSGGDAGNQAHHFWFYVQVSFESGPTLANLGVIAHETILWKDPRGISLQDAYLGYEGVKLGHALSAGSVNATEVGDYLRRTLSPGSASALYYEPYLQSGVDAKWYPAIP